MREFHCHSGFYVKKESIRYLTIRIQMYYAVSSQMLRKRKDFVLKRYIYAEIDIYVT
jgi:hypothetical protein